MAKLTLQNTIKRVDGTNVANVPVTIQLCPSGAFAASKTNEFARQLNVTSNSSGFWSIQLEKNTDIIPTGTWYEVYEAVPKIDGGPRTHLVGITGAVTPLNLADALLDGLPNTPTVYPGYPPTLGNEGDSLRFINSQATWRQRVFFNSTPPNIGTEKIGDFWVNTNTQAMYTWNGAAWLLVSGPPTWWTGTQAQFDALAPNYDPNLLYIVKG